MRIYLGGRMRGVEFYNFPAFHAYARILRKEGHEVYSPAERDLEMGFDPTKSLKEQNFSLAKAWEHNFAYLIWAEAIALIPGYETSEGVQLELAAAKAMDRKIIELEPIKLSQIICPND